MTPSAATPEGYLTVDMHVHTVYSKDSLSSLEAVLAAVRRFGLSAVAVIDHNQIEGALRLRDLAPSAVIVGEEVKTTEGEIAGLFLERIIPRGLSPEETIAAIQEQGGLVYIPHPADHLRRSTLIPEAVERIVARADAVEVFNARVIQSVRNQQADMLATRYGIARGAGSDAHTPAEIGRAYVVVPSFDLTEAGSFRAALAQSRPVGRLSSPAVHLASTWAKVYKRVHRS